MNNEESIIAQLIVADMPKTFLPRLNPEWFNDWHKSLISTMQNMYLINEPIGLASLNRYHKDKIVQLVSICNTYTTDREFEYQIKALEYDYKHKQLIERILSINKNDNLSQIVNYLQESISESQLTTNTKVDSISQVTANVLDEMESAIKRGDTKRGIDTGFQYLNRYIGGYNKGNLIIIGGRPGSGKTAMALCMAIKVSQWAKCLFFSLEMSNEEIAKRYISLFSSVENFKIRNGNLSLETIEIISKSLYNTNSDFYLCDDTNLLIQDLKSRCKIHKAKYGLDIVFVDYLQLINGNKKNRLEEISEISRILKATAKELGITIIALAQLSRQSEQRQDKRPLLSDLRESGQIEQDADVILFPFRPAYYENDKPEIEEDAELIIAKNRHGQCVTIPMRFIGKYTKYEELL